MDETVAGIKRQHNVFEQLGIDPEKTFGYKIIEPLIQLRKVAEALGLPEEIYNRMPFPGPALAARVIWEATPERIETVRQATVILEGELADTGAFQYMAILHDDRVTGMRNGERDYSMQIEIRCWESVDARVARPTRLPYDLLERLAERITSEVAGVVSNVRHCDKAAVNDGSGLAEKSRETPAVLALCHDRCVGLLRTGYVRNTGCSQTERERRGRVGSIPKSGVW